MDLPSNLPKILRDAGLNVVEVPGWRGFGRPASTGGFEPRGILWHHTGSKDSNPNSITDDFEYAKWLAKIGRSDLPAPLCQLSVGRNGTVYVCADGRGNHAGRAKASGDMPAGDGNFLYLGIECQNSGTEGWSKAQYEAMVLLGAVLTTKVVRCGFNDNRAHRETSVTGKWDPGALDMSRFRRDIKAAIQNTREPKMNPTQKGRLKVELMLAAGDQALEFFDATPKKRLAVKTFATILRNCLRLLRRAYRKVPNA